MLTFLVPRLSMVHCSLANAPSLTRTVFGVSLNVGGRSSSGYGVSGSQKSPCPSLNQSPREERDSLDTVKKKPHGLLILLRSRSGQYFQYPSGRCWSGQSGLENLEVFAHKEFGVFRAFLLAVSRFG